jgi:hypothetical protein
MVLRCGRQERSFCRKIDVLLKRSWRERCSKQTFTFGGEITKHWGGPKSGVVVRGGSEEEQKAECKKEVSERESWRILGVTSSQLM